MSPLSASLGHGDGDVIHLVIDVLDLFAGLEHLLAWWRFPETRHEDWLNGRDSGGICGLDGWGVLTREKRPSMGLRSV